MRSVEAIADEIIAREGGYVNDPDDPGGATNFGVTIHTMRRLGLDLDRDGGSTARDVRGSAAIRRATSSWSTTSCAADRAAARAAAPTVFDMYVNAGANAVRILQRLLATWGTKWSGRRRDRAEDHRPRTRPSGWRRGTSSTPTGSRGATTTTRWPTAGLPRASTRGGAMAARAAGSSGPRSSSRPRFHLTEASIRGKDRQAWV
jgi:hypothetical protein